MSWFFSLATTLLLSWQPVFADIDGSSVNPFMSLLSRYFGIVRPNVQARTPAEHGQRENITTETGTATAAQE